MRVPKLAEDELQQHLLRLPGWTRHDVSISKTYELKDFNHAMDFVIHVAETAESIQHHPDIDIRYNKVKLTLTTHDSGGLTQNDINLAAACDDFADALPS